MHRIILTLIVLIILTTACIPAQTPAPTSASELTLTAVPTLTIEPLPTATLTATPEPFMSIRLIPQENMDAETLAILQTIPQQIPAWVDRPAVDFAYDWYVFSKEDGSYQESAVVMVVDNTAYLISRTQQSAESTAFNLGDTTIRPLLFKTDEAGNVTYLTQTKNESGEITENILMESATRDDGQEIIRAHLLDGTNLESETATLINPNEFSGKLVMAIPLSSVFFGEIEFNPELGRVQNVNRYDQLTFWNGDRWQPLYESTEYEGIYSEKAKPSFTDSFFYTEPTTGMEIPIHIGLTNDLAISEIHLNDLGKEAIATQWLLANWHRYTNIMKNNDVSFEDYIQLVANGNGNVEINYLDEITGERKVSQINPSNGLSITITEKNNLPLQRTPYKFNTELYTHYHLSTNSNNTPILVIEANKKSMYEGYKYALEGKKESQQYYWASAILSRVQLGIDTYAQITSTVLYNDGVIDSMGLDIITDFIINYYELHSEYTSNSYKDSYYLASVILK